MHDDLHERVPNGAPVLSTAAAARQAQLLPGLLAAVERRRHRRLLLRTVAVTLVGASAAYLAWPQGGSAGSSTGRARANVAPEASSVRTSSGPTNARNDPTVCDRLGVATTVRPEWFVGDGELQHLLRDDARPAGLLRVGDRVFVASDAIDPVPVAP